MQRRSDRGTVRVRLVAARPCVARVEWWAEGRLVGRRRLWQRETDLVLPAGRWTLRVEDDRPLHDPARLAGSSVDVDVRSGWRAEAELVLDHGAVVSGFVADAEPRLARFATVTLTAADGRTCTVRTDGLGAYTLAGLPATAYLVRADKGARRSESVLVEPTAGEHRELDLVLTRPRTGRARSDADALRVGAAFRGTVVDEQTGETAYAAIVEVRDARGTLLARTRTDHAGGFVVGGDLRAASGLTLVVTSGPDRITVDRRHLRGLSCAEAQLVDLGTIGLTRTPGAPRPARASLPRATAAAMSRPATRV